MSVSSLFHSRAMFTAGRVAVFAATAVGTALTATPANVLAQQRVEAVPDLHSYQIAPGSLEDVLTRFARSAGVVLSFDPVQVRGRRSAGLVGTHSVEAGFVQLLSDSGLVARPHGDNSWVLVQASAFPTLGPVEVHGSTLDGSGPTAGYVAGSSISATRTDTPLTEIPQSVSVVTRRQISEQGAHTLNQILRYTPGVAPEMRGATGTRTDSLHLRSFSSSTYLDGLRIYGGPQVDAWRLERVDVLKGPASVMYGRGDPGGLVNMISKRPTALVRREIELQWGNYDYGRASFDFGGPVDQNGRRQYRLVGSGYISDGQVKDTRERRYYVSPAVAWAGEDTSLTLLTNFQHDPAMGSNGSVSPMRTLLPAPDGIRLPVNFYDGDANFEKSDRRSYSLGYLFDHRFNDTLKATQSLRWTDSRNFTRSVTSAFGGDWGYTDSSYLYRRRTASVSQERVGALTLDTNLQARFRTGALSHTLLVGLDYQHIRTDTRSGSGSAPLLNVLHPDNRQDIAVPVFSKDAVQARYQSGLYFQDQVKLNRLSVLLSGRYDWSRELNQSQSAAVATGGRISSSALRAQAFTGRVGAIYRIDNGLAPYLNYAESFEPLGMAGWNDVPFKPVRGNQYEVGVKYQPAGANTMLSVAAFDIRLANMPTTDLDPTHLCGRGACSVQSSEIRTRGLEFEANTEPLRGLTLQAGYSLENSIYSKANPDSSGFNQKGKSSTVTPTHQASLWARYLLQKGPLAGLGVGGGVRYLGTSYADEANTLKVPATTLFDLRFDYDLGRATPSLKGLQVALNVQNLFDRTYIASCLSGISWCWYGYQRSIDLSLRYRW